MLLPPAEVFYLMIAYLLPFDKSEVYVRGTYLLPYWSKVAGLSFSIYAIMLCVSKMT